MPASKIIVAVLLLIPLGALLMLASRKTHSVLDVWLMVVMFSWPYTISLVSFVSAQRYDVGWYIGRVFEVMTSLFVLVVLLSEIIALYAYNTHAAAVERRERERRLTEMATVLTHLSRVNELGQNFYTLIHEISQPLAAISMYARASMKLLDDSTDRTRQLLEPLVEQAARALAIVQHLRSFIKRNGPNPLIQELVGVIDDAVRLACVGAEELPAVDIRYHLGARTAFFDRVQIEQVVVNLVRNAIEAMAGSERPTLTITTDCTPEGMVEISMADTGSGLSPEIRDRLFQPFVTTKSSGLGVGLSIFSLV
jgi:C4-dicarboxylate-specific signal transduction histidine kinase